MFMLAPPELDYQIFVPSRKRAHNMPVIRSLLPSAIITVDEVEADDYRPVVPADKLLLHPPMKGLYAVINWAQEHFKNDILIEVDDDFNGVQVNTGSKRKLTNPDEILAVIENAARACKDLGLTAFCFSRTPNTTVVRPDVRPLVPVQSVCMAFGIMGAARHRKYNLEFVGRGDADWTLQTLLDDRCVYADIRFFFDGGDAFGGRGGNVGLVTPEVFEATSRDLIRKWGKSLMFKAPAYVKNRQVAPIRINVSRTNKTAQR
jgi:hypothetical protein